MQCLQCSAKGPRPPGKGSQFALVPRHPASASPPSPHAGIPADLCADAAADGGELAGLEVEVQLRFEGLALHVQVGAGQLGLEKAGTHHGACD